MNPFFALRGALACAVLAFASTAADAQLFRTYVASDGNDANPCTLPAPCRLLPAALTAVADGGEIWMLDSANFNTSTVNITKSVTILAIPGAVGSVVATGGSHGILIDTASVRVTLRNLVVVAIGGSVNGIHFAQGAQLNVIDCDVSRVGSSAINASAPGSELTVKDSFFRNVVGGVYVDGTVTASIDNVQSVNNSYGVYAGPGSRVTVSNSVLSNNVYGAYASASTGTSRLVVRNSTLSGNVNGIYGNTVSTGTAQLTAIGNTLAGNTNGVRLFENPGAILSIVLDGNAIVENTTAGVLFDGVPVAFSRGNNTFRYNAADLVGGALTAFVAQ